MHEPKTIYESQFKLYRFNFTFFVKVFTDEKLFAKRYIIFLIFSYAFNVTFRVVNIRKLLYKKGASYLDKL